jgi:hypothetical protein
MSVSSENKVYWVYRIFDRRPVSIKAKNEQVQKIAAIDLSTNLPFGLDVPENVSLKDVEAEKSYLAAFKVYTAKNVEDVAPECVEFFEVLDVDQAAEDFIKTYWVYPKLVRFELVEVEPL